MKQEKGKRDRLPVFTERFRELQGEMSNTEFAAFLGMSRQTIGFYCNGDRIPDAAGLKEIAEKCNISADWLLGLSDIKEICGDANLVCNYTGLSKSAIECLSELKEYKSQSIAADFILKDEELFVSIADYLAASAWEHIDRGVIGYTTPGEKETRKYEEERERYQGTFKFVLPPHPQPIFAPDPIVTERFMFGSIIKKLTILYNEFKDGYGNNEAFRETLIHDYVEMYNNLEDDE